ncbi:MAG TPA: tripartite tricarboxylate transporter substrate binding protein [Burkholderiales bacterium]|nr:tripartite tricarboxylate transporter substrate binding protein [Burkholderiales bacterium]
MSNLARRAAAWLVACLVPCAWAQAPAWPAKPVKLVVTLAAGSATDIIGRMLAERLSGPLGQPVIVENRPGAGTAIGAAYVAKADPDGQTFLVTSSAHTVAPFVVPNLSYDTARDLAAVTPLASLPTVLVAPAGKGYRTVQELVAAARAKPGAINFASAAPSTQLNAERFRRSAGFEAVHVPYKGAAEALNEVIAGRVDFYFSPIAPALPHIRDGKIVALAVGSAKRASILPGVPTTLEAGYPDSDYNFWLALFAPARTPRDIVKRMHDASSAALAAPEARERLLRLGAEPMSATPEQFDAYIREELKLNAVLAKQAGLSAN